MGESLAARFLADRGGRILGRNLRLGRAEIDLLVGFGSEVAAVEVKTRRAPRARGEGGADPAEGFTPAQGARIRRAAAALDPRTRRVDLVAVVVGPAGVTVRWLPHVA